MLSVVDLPANFIESSDISHLKKMFRFFMCRQQIKSDYTKTVQIKTAGKQVKFEKTEISDYDAGSDRGAVRNGVMGRGK